MTKQDKLITSDNQIDAHVGNRIRQRRKAVGLTQQQLGEAVGVKFQQVQKYETGKNRVSASKMFLISEVLKTDVLSLYAGLPALHALAGGEPDDLSAQSRYEAEILRTFRACRSDVQQAILTIAEAASKK